MSKYQSNRNTQYENNIYMYNYILTYFEKLRQRRSNLQFTSEHFSHLKHTTRTYLQEFKKQTFHHKTSNLHRLHCKNIKINERNVHADIIFSPSISAIKSMSLSVT